MQSRIGNTVSDECAVSCILLSKPMKTGKVKPIHEGKQASVLSQGSQQRVRHGDLSTDAGPEAAVQEMLRRGQALHPEALQLGRKAQPRRNDQIMEWHGC